MCPHVLLSQAITFFVFSISHESIHIVSYNYDFEVIFFEKLNSNALFSHAVNVRIALYIIICRVYLQCMHNLPHNIIAHQ